jgi:excisionase family DNA binding protein
VTDHLMTVAEVAGYLGVSEKTVRRRAAELGGTKIGSALRFRRVEIDVFLEKHRLDRPRRVVRRVS